MGKVPGSPTTPRSGTKRKAPRPVAEERRSPRVAKKLVASPTLVVRPASSVPGVEADEEAGTGEELGTGGPAEAVAAEGAVVTGAGTDVAGAREEWYTRQGPLEMEELLEALQEEETFVFIRWQGRVKAYSSQDPMVRPPPALAALRLEDVMPLEWDRERQPTLRTGPTIPFWDPRITARMIRYGEVILSADELAWRLKTGESRRNLWKFRASRPKDQSRLKELEDAYLTAYTKYKLRYDAELKIEEVSEDRNTVHGVEEAEAVLAARAPPVQPRTGTEPVGEEELEDEAEVELAVQQSRQPPATGGGTHDVEAGTSGVDRRRVVVPPLSPSPVTGAVAGPPVQETVPPVQGTVPPVPAPVPTISRPVDATELEYLWMEMGLIVREILRRQTGDGGLMEDPRTDQLFNEYAAQFEDDDEGQ